MRLLVVTDRFPYPLTDGYLRHFFLVRELSSRHHVTLVAPRPSDPAHEAPVREIVGQLVAVPGPPRRKVDHLRHLLGLPLSVHRSLAAAARAATGERWDAVVLAGHRPSAIHEADIGEAIDAAGHRAAVIADLCDANADRLRGIARRAGGIRKIAFSAIAWRTEQEEVALAASVDRVLFVTARDRDTFLRSTRLADLDAERAAVVANGVDADYWSRSSQQLGSNTVVFTGAMHYRPNHDAARRLAEEVFPSVRREVPDARLLLVGRDPPSWLKQLDGRDNIEVTGSVADVRPYMERGTVFAAPMRLGSGVQNKVLEALAMGLPVVTSRLVRDALVDGDDGAPPPVHVADRAPDVAAAILDAFARVPSLNEAGRTYVVRNYSWTASAAALETQIAMLRTEQPDGRDGR